MIAGAIELIMKWRVFTILMTLTLVGIAGSGLRFLEFTADYRAFFEKENPEFQALEMLQNTYTKYDNLLFVLSPSDRNVFTQKTLESIEWLTQEAWKIPHAIRVDSITNFQYTEAQSDNFSVHNFVRNPQTLSNDDLKSLRTIAVSDPLLVNRLISPQANVTGVNVTIQLPGIRPQTEVQESVVYARNLERMLRAENDDLAVYLTGILLFSYSFIEASINDIKTLIPMMLLLVFVLLGLFLRTFWGTFASIAVICLSLIFTLGITGWVGIDITAPSAMAPTIILTLGVASCVHIIMGTLQIMRTGVDKSRAIKQSLRSNLRPVFLSSLTTAIGFMGMNFSNSPPLQDLGNIVSIGACAAFVLSVVFLPSLITVLPLRVKSASSPSIVVIENFGKFVLKKEQKLLWMMTAAFILLITFIPLNELNDEYVKYFDETVPFRIASDFANENLTGIYVIEYSLDAGEPGGISRPNYMHKLEQFAQWYYKQPSVLHVSTITDHIKRLNVNLHGDDSSFDRIPDRRDLIAQFLLLYEMSLPIGLDLNSQINVDKSATRFIVTLKSLSTNSILALEERARDWLELHELSSKPLGGTGPSMIFAHLGARNIRSMLLGTLVALALISLCLIVAFRSVKFGITSLLPNLLPAAAAFGIWGLLVGQVGFSLSVVACMTLGIVVDDTVHFLSKYLEARKEQQKDSSEAVLYAFSSVGIPLVITSVVLLMGFLVLSQSTFEVNAGMGLLSAVTIGLALVVDFLFLPPLLLNIEKKMPAHKSP